MPERPDPHELHARERRIVLDDEPADLWLGHDIEFVPPWDRPAYEAAFALLDRTRR